jgi:hypothetical protein
MDRYPRFLQRWREPELCRLEVEKIMALGL